MVARAYRRRDVLALAAGVPAALARRGRAQAQPIADVVIVGGDPAGYALAHAVVTAGTGRVAVVDETPAFAAFVRGQAAPGRPAAEAEPFVRGHRLCFDGWRDRGNAGWGWDDVLPTFKAQETHQAGATGDRGGRGPLAATYCLDPNPAHRAFLVACAMSGYRSDARYDFNGPRPQGVAGFYQKALADDREQTALAAFLEPLRGHPRLTFVPVARVLRVAIDGTRAAGVEVRREGRLERITGGEIVVAAGAVRAAQLLLLAGIGPAPALRALSVPAVADVPGVGANLHDHVRVPVRWRTPAPLAASTVTAGMFTVSLSATPPDLQMDFASGAGDMPAIGMDVTLVRPQSRGAVTLIDADPAREARAGVAPLAHPADAAALVQGVRLARLIMTASVLDPLRGEETAATGGRESTPQLEDAVRALAVPCGHLAGSCAMGADSDPLAVVDARLRVRGVRGLRVAGAAVMPEIVNAPPLAASAMIGGRAAALLDA